MYDLSSGRAQSDFFAGKPMRTPRFVRARAEQVRRIKDADKEAKQKELLQAAPEDRLEISKQRKAMEDDRYFTPRPPQLAQPGAWAFLEALLLCDVGSCSYWDESIICSEPGFSMPCLAMLTGVALSRRITAAGGLPSDMPVQKIRDPALESYVEDSVKGLKYLKDASKISDVELMGMMIDIRASYNLNAQAVAKEMGGTLEDAVGNIYDVAEST